MGSGEEGDAQATSPYPDRNFCVLIIKFVNHHRITWLLMQLLIWSFVTVTWESIITLMATARFHWEGMLGEGGRGEKEFYQPPSCLQERRQVISQGESVCVLEDKQTSFPSQVITAISLLQRSLHSSPSKNKTIRLVTGTLTDHVSPRPLFSASPSRAEVVINGSSSPAVVDRSNESIKHNIQPASAKWRHNQTLSLRIR